MPDYRTMFQSDFLFHYDLDGREVTITIDRVEAGEVTGEGGKKTRKPILFIKGKTKRLAINKTNGKVIAGMYGTDPAKWAGKSITIYPTTTQFGKETVSCIRVRPTVPKQSGQAAQSTPEQPAPPAADAPAGDAA